jgi:hypothetical protein
MVLPFVMRIDHQSPLIHNFARLSTIHIQIQIENLGSSCLSYESSSQLKHVESNRLLDALSFIIVFPSTVLFVASDLGVDPDQPMTGQESTNLALPLIFDEF